MLFFGKNKEVSFEPISRGGFSRGITKFALSLSVAMLTAYAVYQILAWSKPGPYGIFRQKEGLDSFNEHLLPYIQAIPGLSTFRIEDLTFGHIFSVMLVIASIMCIDLIIRYKNSPSREEKALLRVAHAINDALLTADFDVKLIPLNEQDRLHEFAKAIAAAPKKADSVVIGSGQETWLVSYEPPIKMRKRGSIFALKHEQPQATGM